MVVLEIEVPVDAEVELVVVVLDVVEEACGILIVLSLFVTIFWKMVEGRCQCSCG